MTEQEIYELDQKQEIYMLCTGYTLEKLCEQRQKILNNISLLKGLRYDFEKHEVINTADLDTFNKAIEHYYDEEYQIDRDELREATAEIIRSNPQRTEMYDVPISDLIVDAIQSGKLHIDDIEKLLPI